MRYYPTVEYLILWYPVWIVADDSPARILSLINFFLNCSDPSFKFLLDKNLQVKLTFHGFRLTYPSFPSSATLSMIELTLGSKISPNTYMTGVLFSSRSHLQDSPNFTIESQLTCLAEIKSTQHEFLVLSIITQNSGS